MIRIIDTYAEINALFDNGMFQLGRWKSYINAIYSGSANLFLSDMNEYFADGSYTYEKDFLPVINSVYQNPKLEELHQSFQKAVDGINRKVRECSGKELDVDIVLYLGLCNGAGWVTKINGRDAVLLGVEKIIELNWCGLDSMYGLIYHELGHVYQMQYGVLQRESSDSRRNFVWQLFTEGIAMYFEQMLIGNFDYYHQDTDGWKDWCDDHFQQIKCDFHQDLETMTRQNQRYFGDWCRYHGRGDVGYYLGTEFVHDLLKSHELSAMIRYEMDEVYEWYLAFVGAEKSLE
ncbi:MAG: hypothetical protein IJ468_07525 [Lachnospiraceae bacterium]|nr:hypothetical protein [Lachnospiraceae bacterium]